MRPISKNSRCLRSRRWSLRRKRSVTGEDAMSDTYQALNIPPAANERGGFEVLRCAIIEGELHLTLRPVFNEPNDWGRLFAEVARQVAHAYAHQDRFPQAETLARISSAFEAEMTSPPEVTSSVGPIGQG
jgi:hypothetical protein